MSIERARELLAHASAVRPRDTYYPGQDSGHGRRADEEARRDAHAQRMALIAEAMVQAADAMSARAVGPETVHCKACFGTGRIPLYSPPYTTACNGCNGAGKVRL
jgi:hypothetical protein